MIRKYKDLAVMVGFVYVLVKLIPGRGRNRNVAFFEMATSFETVITDRNERVDEYCEAGSIKPVTDGELNFMDFYHVKAQNFIWCPVQNANENVMYSYILRIGGAAHKVSQGTKLHLESGSNEKLCTVTALHWRSGA